LTGFEADVSRFESFSEDLHSSSSRFLTMYSYVVILVKTGDYIVTTFNITVTSINTTTLPTSAFAENTVKKLAQT